jgi:hypothetical protein
LIDALHEPLAQSAADYRAAHATNTAEFFEDLVRRSGVDEQANINTVQELRKREQQAAGVVSSDKWWRILRGVTSAQLQRLQQACAAQRDLAWEQMAPLNRLFEWDIVARLIQKTMPRIAFDAYCSNGRMDQLHHRFGWPGDLGEGHSIVFAHSGVLNGTPFILARTLSHAMGSRTYHGALTISWTEQVADAEGNRETSTHQETLSASIARPFPEYESRTLIVFGNEAAPDLVCSRDPANRLIEKTNRINVVESGPMHQIDISGAPAQFHACELAQARQFFNRYHNDLFHSFYLAMAPLLAIPLYQQHRPHADIGQDSQSRQPCFWEHEAIANYHGEAAFQHPECATRSILKTSVQQEADGSQKVRVTASGFRRIDRLKHVTVHGRDGNAHEVAVPWQEYVGVQNSVDMLVNASTAPGEALPPAFLQYGVDESEALLRRSIVSALLHG